jgi:dTDP-4-amino-4,6-dideoxygalactose transaminase
LHLALLALDLKPGEAIIAPTITFVATANAARFCGADVIFADVDPHTALMTPETLTRAFERTNGRRVRAVLPVHLAGAACDIPALAAIAKAHGAVIIEDACHAVGTTTPHEAVGAANHSAMAVFSFHPVKTIAAGEGGIVTTRDPDLAKRLRLFRSHGLERDQDAFIAPSVSQDTNGAAAPWAYEQHALGYNYRMSDIQAALALSQLHKLAHFKTRRRALAEAYETALAPLGPIVRPMRLSDGACPHLMVALIEFDACNVTRGELMGRLREAGIGAQVHYIPVHRQPYYARLYGHGDLPGAERYYARCLSLPLFASMTEEDVMRVAQSLRVALRG